MIRENELLKRLQAIQDLIHETEEQGDSIDTNLAKKHDQLLTEIYQLTEID